jgi:hypothetical protein
VDFDSIDGSSAAARVVSSALYDGMEAGGRRDARLLLRSSRDDAVFGFLGYPIGEDVFHSHFVLLVRTEVYICDTDMSISISFCRLVLSYGTSIRIPTYTTTQSTVLHPAAIPTHHFTFQTYSCFRISIHN